MSQKRLWIAATIIALIIILGFVFSVPRTGDISRAPEESIAKVVVVPSVTLHDAFKKGTHTITGSLLAPNACANVAAHASLAGNASSTQGILVAITLVTDTNVCLQLPTRINFSTTIVAPAHLPLSAIVNGSVATTTVS